MKVDVVVVAYRSEADIEECLAALADDSTMASVTVVDNGDGASAAIAESLGARALHEPSNPGFGAAVNRGAALGTAEALLVLNPDARISPDALTGGVSRLGDDPTIGAVQGAIVNLSTGHEERSAGRELGVVHLIGRAFGLRTLLRLGSVQALARRVPTLSDYVDRRPDTDTIVESLAATAVLLRRTAFDEIAGFDEGYFLYGEDLDLCRRLRDAGWSLVAAPETWAVHQSGASAASTWNRELSWWEGTLRFARTHWTGWRRIAADMIAHFETCVLVARKPSRWRAVINALAAPR